MVNHYFTDPIKEIKKSQLPGIGLSASSDSPISGVIKDGTGGNYSHAFWIIWDEINNMPVAASQDLVFKTRPLLDYLHRTGKLKVYYLKITDEEKEKLMKVILEDLGKPKWKTRYDWPMFIGQTLASITKIEWFKKIQAPWIHFCSEIIASHLKKALNIIVTNAKNKPVKHPNPPDLNEFCRKIEEKFGLLGRWVAD